MCCVVAQVFGSYAGGLNALHLSPENGSIVSHGFCTFILEGLDDNVLREAWRDRITQELAA
jgi:hypothetical protein